MYLNAAAASGAKGLLDMQQVARSSGWTHGDGATRSRWSNVHRCLAAFSRPGSVPLSTLLTFASRGARHLECRGTWAPSHHGSIGPVGPCATGDATRRGSAETMAQRAWEDLCLPWERLVWAASYLCYLLPQKERILWVWYDRQSSRLLGPVNIPRLSMWSKNRLRPRCGSPSAGRTAAKSGQGIGDRHNT